MQAKKVGVFFGMPPFACLYDYLINEDIDLTEIEIELLKQQKQISPPRENRWFFNIATLQGYEKRWERFRVYFHNFQNAQVRRVCLCSCVAFPPNTHRIPSKKRLVPAENSLGFVHFSNLKTYSRLHNGISKVTPYEMRHTFASVHKKMPAGLLKAVVWHTKDMATFGVYGHELDEEGTEIAKIRAAYLNKIIAPVKTDTEQ